MKEYEAMVINVFAISFNSDFNLSKGDSEYLSSLLDLILLNSYDPTPQSISPPNSESYIYL
jgi:hypothetical protein